MRAHKYPRVNFQESDNQARTISGVPTTLTAFVGLTEKGPRNKAMQVTSWTQFREIFGESKDGLALAVSQFFINGGREAIIVSVENKRTTGSKIVGSSKKRSGIYALDRTGFNLLCIPPYDRQTTSITTYRRALSCCKKNGAILLIDSPNSWKTAGDVKKNLNRFPSDKDTVIYFPRVKTKEGSSLVPCGAVAGMIARTDYSRGVWKAPAGSDAVIHGIEELTVSINDNEINELSSFGVNCLRKTPDGRFLVWGARTREDSEWKYVPVRRTFLFLESSLKNGLEWTVFEPNDEPLWSSIRNSVITFMEGLFRQGAFMGRTSMEAYFVRCDRSTMTQNDINNGIVNLQVGFAPLKPAEFVEIQIRLGAKQK